jgi:hypothetical protein
MTAETYDLAPAPDRRVRHENGRLLDEAGETVTRSSYWDRRLADDDVIDLAATRQAKKEEA